MAIRRRRRRRSLAVLAAFVAAALALVFAQRVLAVAPSASFSAPSTLQPREVGQFSSTTPLQDGDGDSIKSVTWTFGDGDSSSGSSVEHSFDGPGLYTVTMTVTDSRDEVGTAMKQVLVDAPPVAGFDAPTHSKTPNEPDVGEDATFTSRSTDPDGKILSYAWDFGDGGTSTAQNPTHAFTKRGDVTVTLRVTDDHGATDDATRTVTVNAPPVAKGVATAVSPGAGQNPLIPIVGQQVTLASQSTDADGSGDITGYAWADHGGGAIGGDSANVLRAPYGSAGDKLVDLVVTDKDGTASRGLVTVTVNAPPDASFIAVPRRPVAGRTMTFTSTASDPDGPLTSQRWDLDGDGGFDDASGPVARHSFARAGRYAVRLRVTDDRGASAVYTAELVVARRPAPPLRAMPNVSVRIAGRSSAAGARLTLLRVRAPRGAAVRLRCHGIGPKGRRGCPFAQRRRGVGRKPVRFTGLERSLPAGVRLTVIVTKRGFVGRYVTFRIRRAAAPKRTDSCLRPGAKRPSRCPA